MLYHFSFLVVFIESIDSIFSSSFEIKAILLLSSVKTLPNFYHFQIFVVFLIWFFLFFMNPFYLLYLLCLSSFLSTSICFFLNGLICFLIWAASREFLLSSNLSFLFIAHLFVSFAFLPSSMLPFKYQFVFAVNPVNCFMFYPPNSSFINSVTFFFFPLSNCFSNSKFELPDLVSTFSAIS